MAAPPELELAGLGVAVEIDPALSSDSVWRVLEHKVQCPQAYLPVTDVVTRPNADGSTYREMTAMGKRIIENIYTTGAPMYEVLFKVIDSPHEHVNLITTDSQGVRRLEFFLRDKATKERVPWNAPKHMAHGGILKVLASAAE